MPFPDTGMILVTGGGSGLGRAIAAALADRGRDVLIAGRRRGALEATAAHAPERIAPVAADLTAADGRQAVVDTLADRTLAGVVHNAGTLDPIGPLRSVTLADWRHAMAVNVEAPLFLTQALLPRLAAGSRVLNISSGAAHKGYAGWGAYCTGKAALYMTAQVWRAELGDTGVLVGSVRPGVVDTPMQDHIREQTREAFPNVDRFIQLKQQGKLYRPATSADYVARVLLDSGDAAYADGEWDIDGGPRPEDR
jgi:NAD(P)-dependent dehydrogenase (short-subunit alcohol dehydrogenase family)